MIYQGLAAQVDRESVVVSVQGDVAAEQELGGQFAWIMNHDKPPFRPFEMEWSVAELHPVLEAGGFQTVALEVVVAPHAHQGRLQSGEDVQGLRLGDVPGVDHVVDVGLVEELYDPRDVDHVVVRIADDSDSHRGLRDD